MRRRLQRLVGQRRTFCAVFMWFGKTVLPDGRCKRYMLIVDVVDSKGKHITPHMWMPLRATDYVYVPLNRGDAIRFEAEVNTYTKGNLRHREIDYGLCRPMNVERIEQDTEEQEA